MPVTTDAYQYAVENVWSQRWTKDAYHYAVENVYRDAPVQSAFHYAVENIWGPGSTRDAYHYSVENVIANPNPATLWVWNSETGEYEHHPWYYYDVSTQTWKQAL